MMSRYLGTAHLNGVAQLSNVLVDRTRILVHLIQEGDIYKTAIKTPWGRVGGDAARFMQWTRLNPTFRVSHSAKIYKMK
jgi:hypothetical protein